jgi:flagellar biosynthesis protein FlhB
VTDLNRCINWFGLAAGVLTLIVLGISLFVPWWQLTVGDDLMKVNASPVNTNFGLFGAQFTLPLIFALNLVSILTFSVSGIVMLFYSVTPIKPCSKQLLAFSYKKPLFSLVTFIAGLLIITSIAALFGVDVPVFSSSPLNLPSNLMRGANIDASVSASFQLPFWLVIAAAALCIASRLYHGHIVVAKESNPVTPAETTQGLSVSTS